MSVESQINDQNRPSYVIGVGASAGGLEALESFFAAVPEGLDAAFVVIQHLSPNFKSLMNQLLARHTQIDIKQVQTGMELEANTIYLIPPRKNLVLDRYRLQLVNQEKETGVELPINVFFHSLAQTFHERAIGIVLSGTGSDGSRGIQSIHSEGGLVMVQDSESAKFDGMPRSAINTGIVDFVGDAEAIAHRASEYVQKQGELEVIIMDDAPEEDQQAISVLFGLLKREYRIDFSLYKLPTIYRRIGRRFALKKVDSLTQYLGLVLNSHDELEQLYRDLLVEVTYFFRDPEAFSILSTNIIPQLLANRAASDEIRVWVPACATGEEAFSMAILFAEEARRHNIARMPEVRIFATDVHEGSLQQARSGLYTAAQIESVPPEYLERYFTIEKQGYRVKQSVRRMVTFAVQDVLQDPPFTKMDLVSCRNMLIYLKPEAQKQVMKFYHFSLKKDGYLFLGPSETLGDLQNEFDAVNRRWRIYRKLRDVRLTAINNVDRSPFRPLGLSTTNTPVLSRWEIDKLLWFDGLTKEFVPAGFLLDEELTIIHVFKDAGQFLGPLGGEATLDFLSLLPDHFRVPIRSALYQAKRQQTAVRQVRIPLGDGRTSRGQEEPISFVTVSVFPMLLNKGASIFYYITIQHIVEDVIKFSPAVSTDYEARAHEDINFLESELRRTKEQLQSTVEELETTNEELQSSNEELIASNEELQSTNEELQSVNEELFTVNSEYQEKINELMQVTNDMQNLQRSSQIGTLFLDRHHRIRDFTPKMSEVFNLLPQDIGRPIEHLLYNLGIGGEELRASTKKVMDEDQVVEREVVTPLGEPYLMRILPYKIETGIIEGVVLTMTDILTLKRVQAELKASTQRYEAILNNQPELVCRYRLNDFVLTYVNETYCNYMGHSEEELLGQSFFKFIPADEQDFVLRNLRALQKDPTQYIRHEHRVFDAEGNIRWHLWINQIAEPLGRGEGVEVQATGVDVTEMKQMALALEESHKRLERLITHTPASVALYHGPDYAVQSVNEAFRQYLLADEPYLNRPVGEVFPTMSEATRQLFDEVYQTGKPGTVEVHRPRMGEGETGEGYYSVTVQPLFDENEQVEGLMSLAYEITDVARKRDQLQQVINGHLNLLTGLGQAVVIFDEAGGIHYANTYCCELLGYDEAALLTLNWKVIDPAWREGAWYDTLGTMELDEVHSALRPVHRPDGEALMVEQKADRVVYQDVLMYMVVLVAEG